MLVGVRTVVNLDCEGTSSRGLPSVLLIIVVFGDDNHLLGNKISRVETHTKLTNHGNVSASLEGTEYSSQNRINHNV